MQKRITLRLAAVAATALLSTPAVTLASSGGQSHSPKACPTHHHSGQHKGSGKGHKHGSGQGKKCGSSTSSSTSGS